MAHRTSRASERSSPPPHHSPLRPDLKERQQLRAGGSLSGADGRRQRVWHPGLLPEQQGPRRPRRSAIRLFIPTSGSSAPSRKRVAIGCRWPSTMGVAPWIASGTTRPASPPPHHPPLRTYLRNVCAFAPEGRYRVPMADGPPFLAGFAYGTSYTTIDLPARSSSGTCRIQCQGSPSPCCTA